jgi:hypothetical protein
MRVDGSVARETARLHVTVLGLIVFGHDVGEFDGCGEGWVKEKTRK